MIVSCKTWLILTLCMHGIRLYIDVRSSLQDESIGPTRVVWQYNIYKSLAMVSAVTLLLLLLLLLLCIATSPVAHAGADEVNYIAVETSSLKPNAVCKGLRGIACRRSCGLLVYMLLVTTCMNYSSIHNDLLLLINAWLFIYRSNQVGFEY